MTEGVERPAALFEIERAVLLAVRDAYEAGLRAGREARPALSGDDVPPAVEPALSGDDALLETIRQMFGHSVPESEVRSLAARDALVARGLARRVDLGGGNEPRSYLTAAGCERAERLGLCPVGGV